MYTVYELDLVVMSDRGKRYAGYIKAEKLVPKTALERENEKKIEPMGNLKNKK